MGEEGVQRGQCRLDIPPGELGRVQGDAEAVLASTAVDGVPLPSQGYRI